MLVTAVAILVSDRITMDQLKLADELLDNFCKLMPKLYGKSICQLLDHFVTQSCFINTIKNGKSSLNFTSSRPWAPFSIY